jgi:hypothetical protein
MTPQKNPLKRKATTRRSFLGQSMVAGLTLTGVTEFAERTLSASVSTSSEGTSRNPQPLAAGQMPTGQLGKLKVSRLISGGNLLSCWCHQRDLLFVRNLAEAYLTETKQFDTLQKCEGAGINTIMIDLDQMPILKKYKQQRGGRIQTIVSVRQGWGDWGHAAFKGLKTEIARTIDQGADTIFLHGGYCDRLVQANQPEQVELIGQAITYIREQGLAAGLGSHALEVPMACDQQGIQPDYYVKTFHHDRYWSATPKERRRRFCVDGPRSLDHDEFHDNIFCIDPEATAEYMRDKKQPWIAFKVLAAGAIQPKSGFAYCFENGVDFVAVGMFDFEVAEDVKTAREVLKEVQRDRPWRT